MKKIMDLILKNKFKVLLLFIIFTIISLFLIPKVEVDYNMMDYLPSNVQSTKSLDKMYKEFSYGANNARVMLKNVTLQEALVYKNKISKVAGVSEINFLDTVTNINVPINTIPKKTLEAWYKNKNALISLTIDEDRQNSAVEKIRTIIKDKGIMSGEAVNTVEAENLTSKELVKVFMIAIPIILIILILTTSSYFEPILFLLTIGIAIILNMGSNVIFGKISFVTSASGAILQLAVSMDYSIFLLHRFAEYRKKSMNVIDAMKNAVVKSFSSILSSGLTTIVGFACLIIMKFKVGPDMGIVMSKGIIFSLICVLILLPILTIYSYKLIDKTAHKKFIPSFSSFAKKTTVVRKPLTILFILLIIPSFLSSLNNKFIYGGSKIMGDNTKVGKERNEIEKSFGTSNMIIIMVPKGDLGKETALTNELYNKDYVTNILGYVPTVGESIPVVYVPSNELSKIVSNNYSRLILTINTTIESDKTFKVVEDIRNITHKYYKTDAYVAGTSVSTLDMKNTVVGDNLKVNIVAILAVLLILLLTFKSVSLPIILILVIETSIWLNLSYVYFLNQDMSYIAYLIISSIQLGATIDYAILFTNRYLENRINMDSKEASIKTISDTFISILTSALILMICGFILGAYSSNSIIAQLGTLVGRGALISMILVIFVLPELLVFFDKLILNTTKNMKVFKKRGKSMKKKLCLLLLIPLLFVGMSNVKAESKKEENVYGILNSNGSVNGIYVVNSYSDESNVKTCDYGNYSSVSNLSNLSKINYKDNKACFTASKGKFYYQGNLISKDLPWNFNIKYYLNGKEKKAEKIVGKDGKLKIVLSINENTNVKEEFFDNYLLQVTLKLNTKKATNIVAEGATIANVSDDKQMLYTILAGNEKEIVVSADVTDFEMEAITINAVPMKLDIESENTTKMLSTLKSAATQIQDGMALLNSNSSKLTAGSKQVLDSLNLINDSLSSYDYVLEYFDEIQKALDVLKTIDKDLFESLNSSGDIQKKIDEIKTLYGQIDINSQNYQNQLEALRTLIKTKYPDNQELLDNVNSLIETFENNKSKIDEIVNNIGTLDEEVQKLNNAIDKTITIMDKIKELRQGIETLATEYKKLDTGINEYTQGFSKVYDGYNQLYNGTQTALNGFLAKLKNENYTPSSFTSDSNKNVSSVQFIIKTKDLQKISTIKIAKEDNKQTSFFDKIVNLFK